MGRIGTRWGGSGLELTERQQEVLKLLSRGYSNPEIAEALGISLDGAKFHVSEIMGKLGVNSREEAVTAWRDGRRRLPLGWIALGIAGVAAASVVLFVIAVARDATQQSDAPQPTPLVEAPQPTPFKCPPARTATPTGRTPVPIPPMDGPASVVFNGRRYSGFVAGFQKVGSSQLGPEFGEVCFDSSKTWPLDPADDTSRDGVALHMNPGTELFAVKGYSTGFRLAAPANGEYYLFQAMPNEGDYARDVLDISGKVTTVNLYRDEDQVGQAELVASTNDSAVIGRLVNALLEGRCERPPLDRTMDAYIGVQLMLGDGTEVSFGFHPDASFLDNYRVPAAFGDEVRALLEK
jgi:DNA-binding CsgD family transcriptional regulator